MKWFVFVLMVMFSSLAHSEVHVIGPFEHGKWYEVMFINLDKDKPAYCGVRSEKFNHRFKVDPDSVSVIPLPNEGGKVKLSCRYYYGE